MKKLFIGLLLCIGASGFCMEEDSDDQGWGNMGNGGMINRSRYLIGVKERGDSLDDCKQLTLAFGQKMYQDTGLDAHALVDKQYAWLQGLRDKNDPELNIIYALDETVHNRLVSCMAYLTKIEKRLCVLRMIAIDPNYWNSGVFAELVSFIPTLSGRGIEKALTCVRRLPEAKAIMQRAGFEETDFNPEGCPIEQWQGYEKTLVEKVHNVKKIKK